MQEAMTRFIATIFISFRFEQWPHSKAVVYFDIAIDTNWNYSIRYFC